MVPRFGLMALLVYAFLLLFSWSVQLIFPTIEKENYYAEQAVVSFDDKEVILTLLNIPSPVDGTTILFLPDLRFDTEQNILAESLSNFANVTVTEYPTRFSNSSKSKFSIETRVAIISEYIDKFVESNEIHIVGYGYGGLVAAHLMSEHQSDRYKSSIFINSLGIEELYFLGNQKINRGLFTFYLPIVKLYKYAVPHFGHYHNQTFNVDYVRGLIETDQKKASNWFRNVIVPTLTIHSQANSGVPFQSSVEIHRLIPQSELMVIEEGELSDVIHSFFNSVKDGDSISKADASQVRVDQSLLPIDSDSIDPIRGSALLTILLIIVISAIIHEDLTSISAGLLVASGVIDLQYAIAACFTGIFIADTSTYLIGRNFGMDILKRAPLKWVIKKRDIEWAKNMFDMRGVGIIFAARFLPGTRLATYFTAGVLKTNFSRFIIYFLIAITVWVPVIVGVSSIIGQPMLGYIEFYQEYTLVIILLFIVFIYSIFAIVIPLTTRKGRREFFVKWVRFKERFIN